MIRRKITDENIVQTAREAADTLSRGFSIIFPTDTIYGLGVDALNDDAINLFFSLKKRSENKPVPLFIKNIEMARNLAEINDEQEILLKELWPGPFTVILKKKNSVSDKLTSGSRKVGLRIPNDNFCRILLDSFNGPITSSSANISGLEPADTLDEIIKQFSEHSVPPDYVVEDKEINSGEPSTVIDISKKKPKILRMNQATSGKIEEIFNKLNI